MNEKRYVQHISGQGQKWEICASENDYQWVVRSGGVPCGWHFVPKSEYRLCEPPEEWEDVTSWFMEEDIQFNYERTAYTQKRVPTLRLRKIDGLHHGPAFIIERRNEKS